MAYTQPENSTEISVSVGKISAVLTVEILPTVEQDTYGPDRQHVWMPTLRITNRKSYDEVADPIVIRGRDYSVDQVICQWPNGTWQNDTRVYGSRGMRNDNNVQVEWRTATHDRLTEVVTAARDLFILSHPDYAARSKRLWFDHKINGSEQKADELRKQADKLMAEAAELATTRDNELGAK